MSDSLDTDANSADVEVDWKHMAWTQSLAAGRAWDAGYAAAKDQYSGYGIDIDKMAGHMYEASVPEEYRGQGGPVPWEALVQDAVMNAADADHVEHWRTIARAALNYIEKQADA